jgi:hypothetical protein
MRNRMLKLNLHGFTEFITGLTPSTSTRFPGHVAQPDRSRFLALSAGSRGLRL